MKQTTFIARSALFVPGNRIDRIEKAISSEADYVIIDLEDAVAPSEKTEARKNACQMLQKYHDKNIIVRINSSASEYFEGDINSIVMPGLFAIILPKANTPEDIIQINGKLTEAEKKNDLDGDSIKVIPLIESAYAIENLFNILSVQTNPKRLLTAAFGAVDYTLDMAIDLTANGEELIYPRSKIAISCRAAGLEMPIDAPYVLDVKNEHAVRTDALRAKQLGFGGKLCVHPIQVPICNSVFSPTMDEVEYAKKVVDAYEKAQMMGDGAIQLEGRMIDLPVVKRAKNILRIANLKAIPQKEKS